MDRAEKVRFLIDNIKGVGESKAEKIIEVFPEIENPLLLTKIPEAYNKLAPVVSAHTACTLMEQLQEMVKQDESIQLMVRCGIPYFTALNIAKNPLEMEAFQKNPYKIGERNNANFEACDRYAHIKYWESPPDMTTDRMAMFINAMLLELEQSGHTFAYMSQLVKKINHYQRIHSYYPDFYSSAVLILYVTNVDMFDVERDTNIDKWRIYRKETAKLESDIAYHIRRLSTNHVMFTNDGFKPDKMKFDEVQLSAINSAALSGLKIITGPPGSGKTAVINGITRYFRAMKPDAQIIMCAPTGRAAKHMSEITGENASTIHKLLGIRQENLFIKRKMLDCDMVICDEASMLNLEITYQLLSHIPTGAVVYFVGDKDQLPAVGPGNVLHDIINSNTVPTYHLTKVYRQDGIILENAHYINKGVVPVKFSDKYKTETFDNAEDMKNAAVKIFQNLYNEEEPFETQILIPSYNSECGIKAINQAIQQLNPESFVYLSRTEGGYSYKKNDKILMVKNDKDGQYQNGSVGIFLANLGDEIEVDFEGQQVRLPKTAINDMTLGYAISVHKSQGSEYKHVIICLPDNPQNMLKRNILYTGVTRAKQDIIILAMTGTIEKSVKTSMDIFMQTGLKDKLM